MDNGYIIIADISEKKIEANIAKPESLEGRNKVYADRAISVINNPTGKEEMRNTYFGIVMGFSAIIPTCLHIFCAVYSLRFFFKQGFEIDSHYGGLVKNLE